MIPAQDTIQCNTRGHLQTGFGTVNVIIFWGEGRDSAHDIIFIKVVIV